MKLLSADTLNRLQAFAITRFARGVAVDTLRMVSFAAICILAMTAHGFAQSAAEATAGGLVRVDSDKPIAEKEDTRYRIGAGDVISIQVLKSPELSTGARVDQRGMIRLPLVEGELFAACKTEGELAEELTKIYLEYKKNPQVQVFVTDFQSRPVAVIGAVEKPGQFRMQRRVRLLELVSSAGGPTDKAGRLINVIHTGGDSLCQAKPSADSVAANAGAVNEGFGAFNLDETLKGKPGSNPFIEPGDIISVPEADQIFVIGHVNDPRAIPLKDKSITVTKAVAMAGGAARDGDTNKIKIIREWAGGAKREIYIDLKAIEKHKAEDVALVPNDIVQVGTSVGKTLLSIVSGALPATLSNGVVRAIP